MEQGVQSSTRAKLRTPQAAAVAGILFSLLAMTSFLLLWISVPADPEEAGSWLHSRAGLVTLAVNLMPFSGIALLWFIAVLRDRRKIGEITGGDITRETIIRTIAGARS